MLEEANKVTRLVDHLLTIARADAGQRVQLHPLMFPATNMAQECASLFDVLLEENGQQLKVETTEDTMVCCDWLLLRQALVNVVHNAIKYTPRGGTIVVRIRSEGDQVVVEVEDGGPGIPEDQLSKIFERFYRVEEGRSRGSGGAGLGLAIASWSIEIQGGKLPHITMREQAAFSQLPCPRRSMWYLRKFSRRPIVESNAVAVGSWDLCPSFRGLLGEVFINVMVRVYKVDLLRSWTCF